MNYYETLEFLFSQIPAYHRIGKAAYRDNLYNTLLLDDHFGHPHNKFKSIHVAGTNGKGSVSHMLASVLQEAGFKTGLYTSPHLIDFRERIRINGTMIPEDNVVSFVEANKGILQAINPSFFEMTVAMAFDYFAQEKIDIAVIETGLGGRLDSTNIIDPVLSVITNIGHDHMDLLGDTLEKIAAEKAGIIKKNKPVVIGETDEMIKDVFLQRAKITGSEILFADKYFNCSLEEYKQGSEGRRYVITYSEGGKKITGTTVLSGDYQVKNLTTVFGAVNRLKSEFNISEINITEGISKVRVNTGFSGRWQVLCYKPLIICDTGHNKEGLEYVARQLEKVKRSKLHIILGFVNDKDTDSVLPLLPPDAIYYFTKASVPRAMNEILLMQKASDHALWGRSFADVPSAIRDARNNAGPDDVIFIGGSTFIVADALKFFEE